MAPETLSLSEQTTTRIRVGPDYPDWVGVSCAPLVSRRKSRCGLSMAEGIGADEVYRFVFEYIDSVPQLEALLLLWNDRPKQWTDEELLARLFLGPDALREIMQGLIQNQFVAMETQEEKKRYSYRVGSERMDELIKALDATYRRELVRVSHAIHSKSASGAREFGRAFRFKKDT